MPEKCEWENISFAVSNNLLAHKSVRINRPYICLWRSGRGGYVACFFHILQADFPQVLMQALQKKDRLGVVFVRSFSIRPQTL